MVIHPNHSHLHFSAVFFSCVSQLYLSKVFVNCISQLYFLCTHKDPGLVVHHNHSHLRAKTSRAQVAFTHMKNKLENALETNSNLQISNLARVQTSAGQGDSTNSWSTSSSSSSSAKCSLMTSTLRNA